jgi:hypothetical protein
MFLRKSRHTVQGASSIKLIQSHFTSLGNADLKQRENATTVCEIREVTVGRSILFRKNSPKQPRNRR